MKDNMKTCDHSAAEGAEYKEVVVVGNGPSGMVASFMLAGNVPYLKTIPEDLPIDDMLRARLSNLPEGVSLYEADLMALAEGLEGRSQNPIPLLMDNLLRPCADLGIMADPLIEWRHEADKQIDHIVLGRGPPGGSWHTFPASVRTLSPAAWLCLPPHVARATCRLPATAVAKYCRRYVHALNLQRYFRSNVLVTSVAPLTPLTPLAPPGDHCDAPRCPLHARYQVQGYEISTGIRFRYVCDRVVLCGGNGSRPNELAGVARAAAHYTLPDFDTALARLSNASECPRVLVVGGGVSGADAVWAALGAGATVAHAHRGPADTLARLDPATYPDYCQVYKMMLDGPSSSHPNYTSYPNHVIIDVVTLTPHNDDDTPLKHVTLLDLHTNETTQIEVHLIGVFIGSKPDLNFLQVHCECDRMRKEEKSYKNHWSYIKSMLGQSIQSCKSKYLNIHDNCKCDLIEEKSCSCKNYTDGIGFGVDPKKPVDSRNPMAIDKSTHEVLNCPKGLYALGPLTADTFMRFIPGGALASVSHILRDRK